MRFAINKISKFIIKHGRLCCAAILGKSSRKEWGSYCQERRGVLLPGKKGVPTVRVEEGLSALTGEFEQ